MNKNLKYIHIFGTSFSSGGGFNWSTSEGEIGSKAHQIYKDAGEELTIENYAISGQLRKLIKDEKIKIINHAKWGYGNELIYRKTFDICNDPNFKKDENLFLFEFSYIGRKEFYSKKLNSYFIINYNLNDMEHLSFGVDYSKPHLGQGRNPIDVHLDYLKEVSKPFLDDTLYFDSNLTDEMILRNLILFSSFLKINNLNYYYTQPPVIDHDRVQPHLRGWFDDNFNRTENIRFDMGQNTKVFEGFSPWFNSPEQTKYKLPIVLETNGLIDDWHMGLWASKIVSYHIYNRLRKDGYIKGEDIEFPKKPKLNLVD